MIVVNLTNIKIWMKVSQDEKKNQIALSLIEGVGDKIGKKLLAYFGSAKAIF